MAEEWGCNSIWLSEHHFSVYGILGDTLTMAAPITQHTKRIKIGAALYLLPFVRPVRVAEQVALVDTVLATGACCWVWVGPINRLNSAVSA